MKDQRDIKTNDNCIWIFDENVEYVYDTSCNEKFSFVEGGIKESCYVYCPFCGRVIKEAKDEDEDEDEDE